MRYDFTSIIDRKGRDALAVDGAGMMDGFAPDEPKNGFSLIPMWVADMNFATAPSIQQALKERISHPLYGYFMTSDEYYDSIISWHERRHGISDLKKDYIGYENGVLGGVVSALNVICQRGDSVLLHSPTYIGFTGVLSNNGYNIVLSQLTQDSDGAWRMDYDDMEQKICQHEIRAAIFCTPHNPTGRVWQRWELEKAMDIFRKHNVLVISDEIWSDIILEGHKHIPLHSINEDAKNRVVSLYAPSKTFNLAGMIGSYHIIYNEALRRRIRKEASLSHYNNINVLSMHALVGAYSKEGEAWVDELCQVLSENVNYACTYIKNNFAGVDVFRSEGTYMIFVDCTRWCKEKGKTLDEVMHAGWDAGVAWQDGRPFHGDYHLRMNLALPMELLEEALDRLKKYVFT